MVLTAQEELADLFRDALRIAGSPEEAKSALRNFLHDEKTNNARNRMGANDPHTSGLPPVNSLSPASPTISMVASPPGPVPVGRVVVPPFESDRTVWGTFDHDAVAKMELVAHTQVPTKPIPRPSPTINSTSSRVSTPGPSLPDQDYGDVLLMDPRLRHITADDSELSPAMFRYVKYMIHHDEFYLGEASMDQYKRRNSGFSRVDFSVPPDATSLRSNDWYAVSCGRAVGIYLNWLEVEPLVNGCTGNAHKKFKSFREAVIYIQAALLKGTIEVVPL